MESTPEKESFSKPFIYGIYIKSIKIPENYNKLKKEINETFCLNEVQKNNMKIYFCNEKDRKEFKENDFSQIKKNEIYEIVIDEPINSIQHLLSFLDNSENIINNFNSSNSLDNNIIQHPLFKNLLKEYQNLKNKNDELNNKNDELNEENKNLKRKITDFQKLLSLSLSNINNNNSNRNILPDRSFSYLLNSNNNNQSSQNQSKSNSSINNAPNPNDLDCQNLKNSLYENLKDISNDSQQTIKNNSESHQNITNKNNYISTISGISKGKKKESTDGESGSVSNEILLKFYKPEKEKIIKISDKKSGEKSICVCFKIENISKDYKFENKNIVFYLYKYDMELIAESKKENFNIGKKEIINIRNHPFTLPSKYNLENENIFLIKISYNDQIISSNVLLIRAFYSSKTDSELEKSEFIKDGIYEICDNE